VVRATTVRSREKITEVGGLTDGSVCPTLVRKGWRLGGAGAFACQPIFSRLLREWFPRWLALTFGACLATPAEHDPAEVLKRVTAKVVAAGRRAWRSAVPKCH